MEEPNLPAHPQIPRALALTEVLPGGAGCGLQCPRNPLDHHARVRQIANVNLWITRRHRISTNTLLARLGLRTMRQYVADAALSWIGKCVRMEAFRLPRQLLFSWIRRPRSRYATKTHGATIREHLRYCLLPDDPDAWIPIAQDFSFINCQIGGQGTGRRTVPALPEHTCAQAAPSTRPEAGMEAARRNLLVGHSEN